MSQDRPGQKSSDFERFQEERKRYTAAKREARRLRDGSFETDRDVLGHPWALASKKAKSANESEVFQAERSHSDTSRKWRLALSGLALVCLLGLSLYGAISLWTSDRSSEDIVAAPIIHTVIWHDVNDNEAMLLHSFAPQLHGQLTETSEAHIRFVPNIATSLRATPLADWPSIIVTDLSTAMTLASSGYLQPIAPLDPERSPPGVLQTEQYWLPLSPAPLWTRPVVAVVPLIQSPEVGKHAMDLAYHILEQIRSQS